MLNLSRKDLHNSKKIIRIGLKKALHMPFIEIQKQDNKYVTILQR